MAVFQVKSLEEICFTSILWTLEEYTVDGLGLLTKDFRNRMLHILPIVDICQLEGTQFTSGLDMDLVWENLYKDRIDPRPITFSSQKGMSWRERFFTSVYSTILKDDRPYGYFQLMTHSDKSRPWVGSDITEDRPGRDHPVDSVNYLIAMKWENNPIDNESHEKNDNDSDQHNHLRRKYGPVHVVMKRHEVTLVKGTVPPGTKYHQACQSKQLVPPRYAKFLSGSSCFLPDSTAIKLINKECHFCPREVSIFVSTFSTFLQSVRSNERSNLHFLSEFFKEVEALTIHGEVDRSMNWRVIRGAKAVTSSEEIPSMILGLILSNANPNLARLNINVSKTVDDVTPSITPILTSSYNGLKEISVHAGGKVSPDLKKLISITEHQSLLHTISISINEITQSGGSFGPIVKHTPQVSFSLLQSWIHMCFKKPSLYNLKLSLSPVSAEVLLQILIMFCSTPCSHDQTLTFSYINLREDSSRSGSHKSKTSTSYFPHSSGEPPSDFDRVTSNMLPHQFDDALNVQYKSLIFDHCSLEPSFTASVFGLQLKLKQLVIDDYHVLRATVFSTLAQQPGFDIQSLRISSMGLRGISFNDYDSLLHKQSLKNVSFVDCSFVDPIELRKSATLEGFHLDEKSYLDKTFTTAREKFTYTLTRK